METAWLDGRPADAEALRELATSGHGHFTTLQVRAGGVQGLALHLQRLRSANLEIFGTGLDLERLQAWMDHAARVAGDCGMRVTVLARRNDEPGVLVTTSPASVYPSAGIRVQAVALQRHMAHLKHVGTFAQWQALHAARRDGYDDALLVDPSGRVAEGTFWNIVFSDGGDWVWPDAPALPGVTARLLHDGLAAQGARQVRRPVAVADLARLAGAYAVNARGLRVVSCIDGHSFHADPAAEARLLAILANAPRDPLSRPCAMAGRGAIG